MGKRSKRNKRYRAQNGKLIEITSAEPKEVRVSTQTTPEANALDFGLEIPDDIFQKVLWWIHKANHEVSGFGSLVFDEAKKVYRVTDVILLKQEVGPTSTEIDPNSLGNAMFRMKDHPGALKWHWHSHVDMGVFWSGDDRELIRSLGQRGWIIATVFNKKREMKTAFQTQAEVMGKRHDIFKDDVPTFIQRYLAPELCEALDKEYDDNVKTRTVAASRQYNSGWDENDEYWGPYKGKIWKDGKWIDDTPEDTLSESRWSGGKKIIMATEYDKHGFVKVHDKWKYNPSYDTDLKTYDEKVEAVGEMRVDEIEFMKEHSPSFEKLVDDYILREARKVKPEVFVEA